MPKVSIIVPVYGVEKYIYKCIDSILNQTYTDFELIVINDGTKDNSIKIIEDNFNDERLKIYNRKNHGLAATRNFGVTKASGDYLFFIDSDDFISLDCLEKMVKLSKNTDLVICDYYKYYSDDNKTHISIIPHYDSSKKIPVISMPGAVCKLIKKEVYDKYKIKFLEGYCHEDNAIIPFLCAVCKNYKYIQEPFYYYVHRQGSELHRSSYNKKWEDIFYSLECLENKFKEYNMYEEYYSELEYIYIEYLIHAAGLRFMDYKEGIPNINKIHDVIKNKYPNFNKNKYFKLESFKYKVMCNLIYRKKIKLIKLLTN